MESKRQAKFSRLIQRELATIFLRKGKDMFDNEFISVNHVKVSPDFGLCRAYLSFMKSSKPLELLEEVRLRSKEIKALLAHEVKNEVRKIPELEFYYDDTLDVADHIGGLIKELNALPKSQKELDADEYKDLEK